MPVFPFLVSPVSLLDNTISLHAIASDLTRMGDHIHKLFSGFNLFGHFLGRTMGEYTLDLGDVRIACCPFIRDVYPRRAPGGSIISAITALSTLASRLA